MAIFRNVNMSFWTDTKVIDDYTPEDRYFMLYALTNNYTNIIGCYEISIKQMSNDLGYNKDVVENLLKRFKEVHKTIDYDFNTKELMVTNWHKYNWSSSPKLDNPLYTAIENVKSDLFHDKLANIYNERSSIKENEDMVLIPYRYGIDTTITITSSIPITNSINNKQLEKEFEEVWKDYPKKQGKPNALKSYIKARKNGVEKDFIINAIKKYKSYVDSIDWLNYKNGSTWFNQECWNDDYNLNDIKNNKKPTREEIVPEWLNKDINSGSLTKKEKKEMDDLLKDYQNP